MARRERDYAREYARRLELAALRGLSRSQGRGHARTERGELGAREMAQTVRRLRHPDRDVRARAQRTLTRSVTTVATPDELYLVLQPWGWSRHDAFTLFFSPENVAGYSTSE